MSQTPLTRANVTAASRVTLPFYAVWNIGLGFTWAVQDASRSSIATRAIRDYVSIDTVGTALVILGSTIAAGLFLQNRKVVSLALLTALIIYAIFGIAVIRALSPELMFTPWPDIQLQNDTDSLTASYWFFAFAIFYFASAKSVFFDEPRS